VDLGKFGRKNTPIRILVPKGRKDEARYAAEVIPRLFTRLEDYFQIPYAYEKLDHVAVPLLYRPGAMENAGMITYGDVILLGKPGQESIRWQQQLAYVTTHEMSHQWFGDLVTLEWWNDAWLNEAFATWMADHILMGWNPEWKWDFQRFLRTKTVTDMDGLPSARRIAQPAESKSDIFSAFDSITYNKGSAVITMFETSIGADPFQRAVRRYLREHAFGNSRAEDFLAALNAENSSIAPAFRTFLDQPGIPEIVASVRCKAGAKPVLELRQKRSQPLGVTLALETWQIPVCVRYEISGKTAKQCTMLQGPTQDVALSGTSSCPAWLLANADAIGYYRVSYSGEALRGLFELDASQLTLVERASIIADAQALLGTGGLSAEAGLGALPLAVRGGEGEIIRGAIQLLSSLDPILPDDLVPNRARFVRKTFGELADKLGWASAPADTPDTKLLRATLLPFVATQGKDEKLGAAAKDLALKWLADRQAVEPDIVGATLNTAAYFGDRKLFDQFRAAALASTDPNDKQLLLVAMANFSKPEIAVTALEELTKKDFDSTTSFPIFTNIVGSDVGSPGVRETRRTAFDFITSHFDKIAQPDATQGGTPDLGARLPRVGYGVCSREDLERKKAFFGPRAPKFTGGALVFAHTIERIESCIARKEAQQASLAAFYSKY
jgi:alanyl aminopeptidase